MVCIYFSSPPPNHPRNRAHLLVFDGGYFVFITTMSKTSNRARFDGGYLFFITTTQPPSKTSAFARFRRWLFIFHPTILKNEHTRSFSRVVSLITNFGMTRRCPHLPAMSITHFGMTRMCPHLLATSKLCSTPVENPCTNLGGFLLYLEII
jgi:hypothetical protein